LVNIQSHLEFDSHCLNRDTWVDENVKELLSANFLFWQRGHTTSQAMQFMSRYSISESMLPHTCMVDPRTGMCLQIITGYRDASAMSEILLHFLDRNNIEEITKQDFSHNQTKTSSHLDSNISDLDNVHVFNKLKIDEPRCVTPTNLADPKNLDIETVNEDSIVNFGIIPIEPASKNI
jgi:hypothetical protein